MTTPQRPLRRIAIVGAGLAGASAATALREHGFDGDVTLFGQEPHHPYELPPLSKGILTGSADEPDWVHEPGYYADHGIDLRRDTTVTALHPDRHTVVDADGGEHGYDRLLLATGSRPRILPALADAGVHLLRTWDDALTLRKHLSAGARVVIVGAGWIGCEVAAAARTRGAEVTVVDPLPLPLHRVLGDELGAVFRDLHSGHGVAFRFGAEASGIDTRDSTQMVRLNDGSELGADVVVAGVGAVPRTDLAGYAGLELAAGGVAVDPALRTSDPDIYAVGDIAAHDHPRFEGRVRVEHWANAQGQGRHVAGNLLGGDEPYTDSPYFFSDQYDLGMEYVGHLGAAGYDRVDIEGSTDVLAGGAFRAYWVKDGTVVAAMHANDWDASDAIRDSLGTHR